jgi:hypothetical protein
VEKQIHARDAKADDVGNNPLWPPGFVRARKPNKEMVPSININSGAAQSHAWHRPTSQAIGALQLIFVKSVTSPLNDVKMPHRKRSHG